MIVVILGGIQYPNVRCEKHHTEEPGYGVCVHVFEGTATIHEVERATKYELGMVKCKDCSDKGLPESAPVKSINGFRLCCASCCRENGWLFDK